MITETFLETDQGKLYLNKLCKYFSRQVPVSIINLQGRIDLHCGLCRIQVTDKYIHFHIDVDNNHDIDKVERVIAEQVSRITHHEKPNLQWNRHH